MRLWHYLLIPYLPDSQLIAQWRELNAIYGNPINHILINYVKEYSKSNLLIYSKYVINEMKKRNFKINTTKYESYFKDTFDPQLNRVNPFCNHHNIRYLKQCFYNLQEKYDRGQKDFSRERYIKLSRFVYEEIRGDKNEA